MFNDGGRGDNNFVDNMRGNYSELKIGLDKSGKFYCNMHWPKKGDPHEFFSLVMALNSGELLGALLHTIIAKAEKNNQPKIVSEFNDIADECFQEDDERDENGHSSQCEHHKDNQRGENLIPPSQAFNYLTERFNVQQ